MYEIDIEETIVQQNKVEKCNILNIMCKIFLIIILLLGIFLLIIANQKKYSGNRDVLLFFGIFLICNIVFFLIYKCRYIRETN